MRVFGPIRKKRRTQLRQKQLQSNIFLENVSPFNLTLSTEKFLWSYISSINLELDVYVGVISLGIKLSNCSSRWDGAACVGVGPQVREDQIIIF